jgi:predicted  nucleic acid-binding Zn-ribbon protein
MEKEDAQTTDIHKVCDPLLEQLDEKVEEATKELQEEIDGIDSDIADLQQQIDDLEERKNKKQEEIDDDIIRPIVEQFEKENLIPAIRKLDKRSVIVL